MFSKYLPLVIATLVLFLAVGLVTYHPTPAAAQSRPADSPSKLSAPAIEKPLVDFTVFNVGDNGKAQTGATGSDSPAVSSTLRISQVYIRGGEAGATYQSDFVEIFNAGSSNVDLNGWTLAVNTFEGATQLTKFGTFFQSFNFAPGTHLLFQFGSNGSSGQALSADVVFFADTNLGSTSGQVMLLSPGQGVPNGCPTQAGAADFLGYGATMCAEGSAATVPPANKSLSRISGGCADSDNNVNDFTVTDPTPRGLSSVTPCGLTPLPTPTPTATPTPTSGSQFNFSASQYVVDESAGKVTITITRTGNVSTAATVDGATSNGTAIAGSDYTGAAGTLSFAPNQTQASVDIPILKDSTSEGDETFFVTLSHPTGNASIGATGTATVVIHDIGPPIPNPSPNPSPVPGATGFRISEIYTRGGEPGATFQNDYVEVINASSNTIDLNGWTMVVNTYEGTTNLAIGATFNQSFAVEPGKHLLFRFLGNGSNGQPASTDFPVTQISLGSTSGQIMILAPGQPVPNLSTCPAGTNAVVDYVGYGTSQCSEGAPAPVPPSNKSLTRINGGCTDTNNNFNDFALLDPNPQIFTSPVTLCGSQPSPTPTNSQFNFSSSTYQVVENAGKATITVIRSGDSSAAATVNFTTLNGTATAGSDYTTASGTLSFASGETQKTFDVTILDDAIIEGPETVFLTLSQPTGNAGLGATSSATLTIADNDINPPTAPNLRISQVYTRGGEPGSQFQNDFIELFNAGTDPVELNGWGLAIISGELANDKSPIRGARLLQSFTMQPGMHVLLRFQAQGSGGVPVPGEYPIINDVAAINSHALDDNSGQIMLLSPSQNIPTTCPASFGFGGTVTDMVGYGNASCFEGARAVAPPPNQSLTRVNGGCTDTNNNANDFTLANPNPRSAAAAVTPCGSVATAQKSSIQFSSTQFDASENGGKATITVLRTGDTSSAATVDYSTSDDTATERKNYTTAVGTLRFGAGETKKTFDVLLTDNSVAQPTEAVNLSLGNATGNARIVTPSATKLMISDNDSSAPANPIDASPGFVDQHYKDFLNRVPDASGLAFWTNNIESCGIDLQCRQVKRVDTSAAFFLSIEFQKTGFLVYRLYKASLPATSERPRGFPRYREFVRDSQDVGRGVIVGNAGYEQLLEANTVDFINRFVTQPEFLANYPASMSAAQYVDKLNSQAGNPLTSSQRDALVNGLNNGQETAATILRKIVENPTFANAETRRAFVLMQYYGYLRRNPDDAPDGNFGGYDFWLNKLNQFNGDYKAAEMVKAFITSPEFVKRFGQ